MRNMLVICWLVTVNALACFPAIADDQEGYLKWSFLMDSAEDLSNPERLCEADTSPAIGPDGTIYIITDDNTINEVKNYLYAINQDGSLKWKRELTEGGITPVIGNDGTVYISSSKEHKLYAITSDNILKWEYDFDIHWHRDSYNIGVPSFGSDGNIYITNNIHGCVNYCEYQYISEWSDKYYLYSLSTNGHEKWRNELDEHANGSVVVDEDTVYVPADSSVYAYSSSGLRKWKKTGVFFKYLAVGRDGTLYTNGSDYHSDGNVYNLDKEEKGLFKIDQKTGNTTLLNETHTIFPLVIGEDETIYFRNITRIPGKTEDGSLLHAIDTGGEIKWQTWLNNNDSNSGNSLAAPAVSSNGTVFVASTDGVLHAVKADGVKFWSFNTGKGGLGTSPVIGSDGTIYVGSANNRLYAINSSAGPLASGAWPMLYQNQQHSGSNANRPGKNINFSWGLFLPAILKN